MQESMCRELLGRVHRAVPVHDCGGAMPLLHNSSRPTNLVEQPQTALEHVQVEAAPDQRLDFLRERVLRGGVLIAQSLEVRLDVPAGQGPRATPRGLDHGAVRERRREGGSPKNFGSQVVGRVLLRNENGHASPRRVFDARQPPQLPRHGRIELVDPRANAVVLQELQ